MASPLLERHALVVVDAQRGFDDAAFWGHRNNPACDANVEALVTHWTTQRRPVVIVRHESADPSSPLHPDSAGNALKDYVSGIAPDLVVTKSVNSAFHGQPDLDAWLRHRGCSGLVICGFTTNHCCETTARVGGNLGHDTVFVIDATHTFDRQGPDGSVMSADELSRATATNLHGEFATVVRTRDVI